MDGAGEIFHRWASLAAAAVAAAAAAGAEIADQRRGDVLSVNPRSAERIVHDVVRTDKASNVRCSAADALEKPFAGTAAAEKDKVTEYAADIVPGVAFSPFGCGTQGELGKHAIFCQTPCQGDRTPPERRRDSKGT